MTIKLLRQKTLDDLYSNAGSNLDRYRTGNFDDLLLTDKIYTFDKIDIDHDALDSIEGGDKNDAINCLTLFNAIDGMTPYLARDARIWCYLTHTYLLEYSRNRWPIPADDEKALKHIVLHFFTQSSRTFQRDNAASRLWWPAFVCNKVKGIPLEKSLELLFYRQDVRQGLLDRSSTARIENIYSVIKEIPDIIATNYDELEKLVEFWLNTSTDDNFKNFINTNVKSTIGEESIKHNKINCLQKFISQQC